MAFKSEAQRLKFIQLVKEGKMSQEMFDKWNDSTPQEKLPARVNKPTKSLIRKPVRVK